MPAKRVVIVGVGPGSQLEYALRVDVPEGAEVRRGNYYSSYGDEADPDLLDIRTGTVLEERRTMQAHPEDEETNQQAWLRIQGLLEAEWGVLQAFVSRKLIRSKALGRYWDGEGWGKWKP